MTYFWLVRFTHAQSKRIHTGPTGSITAETPKTYPETGVVRHMYRHTASSVMSCYLSETPWGRDIAQAPLNCFHILGILSDFCHEDNMTRSAVMHCCYDYVLSQNLFVTRIATPVNLCCKKHCLAYLLSFLMLFHNSHKSRKYHTLHIAFTDRHKLSEQRSLRKDAVS